jgi:hypothetical protein
MVAETASRSSLAACTLTASASFSASASCNTVSPRSPPQRTSRHAAPHAPLRHAKRIITVNARILAIIMLWISTADSVL